MVATSHLTSVKKIMEQISLHSIDGTAGSVEVHISFMSNENSTMSIHLTYPEVASSVCDKDRNKLGANVRKKGGFSFMKLRSCNCFHGIPIVDMGGFDGMVVLNSSGMSLP